MRRRACVQSPPLSSARMESSERSRYRTWRKSCRKCKLIDLSIRFMTNVADSGLNFDRPGKQLQWGDSDHVIRWYLADFTIRSEYRACSARERSILRCIHHRYVTWMGGQNHGAMYVRPNYGPGFFYQIVGIYMPNCHVIDERKPVLATRAAKLKRPVPDY